MRKILEANGWIHVRTNGSHFIFNHPNSTTRIDVPIHGNRDMKPGTQRDIMAKAGLTEADL